MTQATLISIMCRVFIKVGLMLLKSLIESPGVRWTHVRISLRIGICRQGAI